MTAKIKASSDGLKVTIGNAVEDALEINQTAKTISGINGYAISVVPAGAMQMFFMESAPVGWLEANGQLVSRITFAALFAAIGTLYGAGDGSTTFKLPDMRGYFPRASGTNADGATSGSFGTKQADGIGPHTHTYQYSNAAGAATTTIARGNIENTGVTIGTSGQPGAATETRPKNIALFCCVKT